MDKKTEALRMALSALEYERNSSNPLDWHHDKTITAIREALAEQPAQQQEPVAWWHQKSDTFTSGSLVSNFVEWVPLYTSPPQRKPLTDEQIKDVAASCMWWVREQDILDDAIELARAIEAKLKENT